MDGQDIKDCYSLGNMYDQDCVVVRAGIRFYRIKADILQKMFKFFNFSERKAKKYTYLENPKLKE